MLSALALAAYLVQPGDTLSGIAASHGASLAAVEAANTQIANPNLIYVGQTVHIPQGSSAAQGSYTQSSSAQQSSTGATSGSQTAPVQQTPVQQTPVQQTPVQQSAPAQSTPVQQSAPSYTSPSSTASATAQTSSGYSSGSLSDIPGVPQSFAACVAYRESTNLQNPAADGNAYGIIPASGYNVYGTSLANQKQVFQHLYQQYGGSPWAADGCPGT